MNKYCITLDTDWVPDEVLDSTLEILDKYGVKATLFCTNKTSCDLSGHEKAIHPNFTTFDFEKHIGEMMDFFPESKGMRSHSLFFSERMRPILAKYDIHYTSNTMMFEQPGIAPYMMSPTTIEIPIYFMDTFNLIMKGANLTFERDRNLLENDGIKVYDFHPIHIFTNTYSIDHYDTFKKHYHDPKMLKNYINDKMNGIRDYFIDLLEHIKESGSRENKLIEVSSEFRNITYAGINNR